jgi:mannose-1-phosphate guanylyltransferase
VALDDTPGFQDALGRAFEPLERTSVDYGLMEGARDVRCVRGRFAWSDVGGFSALEEHLQKDEHKNAHRGALTARDSHDNLVFCDDEEERVALLGVSGLLVVRAGRRTLVVPKERAEEIKQLVSMLPEEER